MLNDPDHSPAVGAWKAEEVSKSLGALLTGTIEEQRERFAFATDAAQIGYWFCDLPFDKLIWDDRVKEHFWLAPEADVDIERFYSILHPDDREPTSRAIQHAIEHRERYDIEYRTVAPDGRIKWIRAIGRAAYDALGNPTRFDGITQEITPLKQTREALVRSEKLAVVGRLAASISHEINNPLEAVTNLIFLIAQCSAEPATREWASQADKELTRVAHIVRHTLRFNRQSVRPIKERLSDILEESLGIYEGRMRSVDISVERDYRDKVQLLCLGSELRQVFANLIGNSFDATPPGGRLLLRTRMEYRANRNKLIDGAPGEKEIGIRVTVADNGRGMSRKVRARLFEPFFSTKGDQGTGLGLWISREILEKHHATLRIWSSMREGKSGTAISMWFPLDSPVAAPRSTETAG